MINFGTMFFHSFSAVDTVVYLYGCRVNVLGIVLAFSIGLAFNSYLEKDYSTSKIA